jgi:hypothetical protein
MKGHPLLNLEPLLLYNITFSYKENILQKYTYNIIFKEQSRFFGLGFLLIYSYFKAKKNKIFCIPEVIQIFFMILCCRLQQK